jgi:hypothetical protein
MTDMTDTVVRVMEDAALPSTYADPRARTMVAASDRNTLSRTLTHGLMAGLLGYVTLVLFFAVVSMAGGNSPFHIAALLAAALFRLPGAAGSGIEPGPVIAYNGLHLVVLILAGTVLAGLARVAARVLQGWYVAMIAVLFVVAHIFALPIWFGNISAELPIWLVVSGTALATIAMCAYLWIANPDIRGAMHEPDE